jgi:DNA invertase Pin-like site-specific DNA recombinase
MIRTVVTGMAVHAGVYGRQSERRANKSEVSTATQRVKGEECAQALIRALPAADQANSSVDYYEDLGISAFDGTVRPDFERLLRDCRSGRINYLIVYYISRLSRMEPADAIPIVTELLSLGVTIVSVTEGTFRKGNLMDLIHLIMRLDAAHSESKNKSVSVRGAKDTARQLGGFVGGKPPYGFKFRKEIRLDASGRPIAVTLLDEDQAEAANIRMWWYDRIKPNIGKPFVPGPGRINAGSLTGIVAEMESAGVPTRGKTVGKETADSSWDAATVKRILSDPRIAGFAADPQYGTKRDGSRSSKVVGYRIVRDDSGAPVMAHPSILPPDEWWSLQRWLEGRGQGKGQYRGQALLSAMGVLFCECGFVQTSAKRDNKCDNYRCRRPRGRQRPGQHEGDCTISQRWLDDFVARRIFDRIQAADDDPETLAMLAEATRRFGAANEPAEIAAERTTLLEERTRATVELDELYADRAEGGYGSARGRQEFIKRERALDARVEALTARLVELDRLSVPVLPIYEWLPAEAGSDPIGPGSWWDSAELDERRAFVRLFVKRITVSKAGAHTGQGVKVADRVTIEFVSAKDEDEDEDLPPLV